MKLLLAMVALLIAAPDLGFGAVCHGLNPSCFAGRATPSQPRVLLVTRTAGPRHANLGLPLAAGLGPPLTDANRVQRGMLALATARGWRLDYTEDLTVIARLDDYDAVVFFSTSREMLDEAGQAALRRHMRSGGGAVIVHNALGAMYEWPYYEGLLGGAYFREHGPHRAGEVIIVDRDDASTAGLPARFPFKDEWYELAPRPRDVRLLATDGEGRPVAWCHYYDGGKVWVTSLGHDEALFGGAMGDASFEVMIGGALSSVMGGAPFCR